MAKSKLNTDRVKSELAGNSAFFGNPPNSRSSEVTNKQPSNPDSEKDSKQDSNIASNSDSNITRKPAPEAISHQKSEQVIDNANEQLTEDQLSLLKRIGHRSVVFRLTNKEAEWLRDTAYELNKKLRHQKISQKDVIRVSIQLLAKALKADKKNTTKIFEALK